MYVLLAGRWSISSSPSAIPVTSAVSWRRRRRMHERLLLSEMLWRPHERPLQWEALRMRRKGVLAEPPSERALRLTW
jgi:hypothetical protein